MSNLPTRYPFSLLYDFWLTPGMEFRMTHISTSQSWARYSRLRQKVFNSKEISIQNGKEGLMKAL